VHIVVIGSGVFGAWTAHHLQIAGVRVSVVDAYGPANARASSGDESRIIRCGYGPDAIYSRWARRSLEQWQRMFPRVAGDPAPMFHACGVLWLAAADDPYTSAVMSTLQQLSDPVERVDRDTLRARFPHIDTNDVGLALFEPDCGVLMARRTVQALVADLDARGVPLLRGCVVPHRGVERPSSSRTDARLERVETADGGELRADGFVFACGPWLPKVFPELLTGRIRPTRQVVIYFGAPPGDDRFGPTHTPAWIEFGAGIYGVPDLESRGIKVGLDRHGPPFDPDADQRVVDDASIETARAWLRHRMPAMGTAPVVESRVCQYENTETGDFLIDRHPDLSNVWIVGGGSGHGFKHAPAIGEYVAGIVLGHAEPEPRFLLSTKGVESRRSVF
jgi:sarcosine oxidase